MPADMALNAWRSLTELAGDSAKIHITGGEPFLCWDRLIEILQNAKNQKLDYVDIIETNGFWATDDQIVKDRLKILDEFGINKLKISCDPFHQEYVDIEPVRRLAKIAKETLGQDRVLVRWEKYLEEKRVSGTFYPLVDKGVMTAFSRKRCQAQSPLESLWDSEDLVPGILRIPRGPKGEPFFYVEALKDYPCRFTGRAGGHLAELFAKDTVEQISKKKCNNDFLGAKGIHIDPYGNVFSGTCSGIIIGNIGKTPLSEIWRNWQPQNDKTIETLFNSGPVGLLDEAVKLGYKPKELYAGKCHLCASIRQFFFDKGLYKSVIGPAECYK